MIKFETDKEIAFVRGNQIEERRGYMLVARVAMKQLEIMILEMLEEWDRQIERKTEPKGELVNIELNGLENTMLVGAKSIESKVVRMIELLRKNRVEFA